MVRSYAIAIAFAAVGLVGCGGDDDKDDGTGAGGSGGGLSDGTALKDLTDAQKTQLCEQNKASIQALANKACTILGLAEATQAECETTRDTCEAALTADGGSLVVDCADSSAADYANCDKTVGDLKACESDLVQYANSLACSQAGSVPAEPQCSQDLQTACPNVFQ
jgi:hypothetical protein